MFFFMRPKSLNEVVSLSWRTLFFNTAFRPLDIVLGISKWQKWNQHENLHHFSTGKVKKSKKFV